MKTFYSNIFLKAGFLFLLIHGIFIPGMSQVGFNNPDPDPSSIIDAKANDKGILIPRMTSADRINMTLAENKPAHSLLVFDSDLNMFFVYDTISNPDRWLAVNPWITKGNLNSNITTATNGKVGIGTTSAPAEKLHVNGNVKGDTIKAVNIKTQTINSSSINVTATVTANKFVGQGTVPAGGIIMWSGITPPAGWALCNGANGTPDLRGRFIAGFNPADPDYNYPGNRSTGGFMNGNTGGEKKHTLTIAEMPNHSHTYLDRYPYADNAAVGNAGTRDEKITSVIDNTSAVGGGQPHENRPPFYTLAYIMKLP